MRKCYCDICGKETYHVSKIKLCISGDGFFQNKKTFELCDCCKQQLIELKTKSEIDFVKASKWWEEKNHGSFYLSGTFEQGGYVCPRCGHCNNAYTFEGVCDECGYGAKRR